MMALRQALEASSSQMPFGHSCNPAVHVRCAGVCREEEEEGSAEEEEEEEEMVSRCRLSASTSNGGSA